MPNHDRFECQTAIDSDAILQLFNGMQNIWRDNNVPELISAGYVKLSPHTIYLFSRVCHRRNT
ncbi:hypothetical protein E4340_23705 [Salmonella enterica subsp. enterica serovar Typhimurium]|nr:hypothetical protein [Salmonella enterica subsp. enterica serovar Typhimurium]